MTNRIGIHALVWVGGWSPEEARRAIASSTEAGYDLIELAALDPESFDADMTARLLEEYDILGDVSLGLDDETDVSSDDRLVARRPPAARHRAQPDPRHRRRLPRWRHLLQARPVHGAGHRTRPGQLGGVDRPARRPAAEAGVTLGLEFCNRYETNVLNTTAQTLQFIDDLGRDNVVAHLDTYHMNIEEISFAGAVPPAAAAGARLRARR